MNKKLQEKAIYKNELKCAILNMGKCTNRFRRKICPFDEDATIFYSIKMTSREIPEVFWCIVFFGGGRGGAESGMYRNCKLNMDKLY